MRNGLREIVTLDFGILAILLSGIVVNTDEYQIVTKLVQVHTKDSTRSNDSIAIRQVIDYFATSIVKLELEEVRTLFVENTEYELYNGDSTLIAKYRMPEDLTGVFFEGFEVKHTPNRHQSLVFSGDEALIIYRSRIILIREEDDEKIITIFDVLHKDILIRKNNKWLFKKRITKIIDTNSDES